ncbi:MAG: YebC/PmpR family DNA-binding transcriptional regulator [Faecousia sp.]
MSGHSKWHNIQKTKGAQDAKRAAAFTKIAKEMIVAVKEGGGSIDPANNSRLATIITKAKAANMPNDNIKRVLERAAGAGSGESYEAINYEGYGPGGVAVIVETMTDNRNRTAGSMRHHFDKYGGNMGATGCVSWSFDKKGVIVIDNSEEELEEDTVMMDAMDCGADDFEPEEDCFTIYTTTEDFNAVADALSAKGYTFASAQIEMVPQNYQKLEKEEDITNMEKMLDLFEDDDDVQNVWHNWDRD